MLSDHTTTLDALAAGRLDTAAFCARWRALPLPAGLPQRFADVRDMLLDRLESSQLFSGESCSFSQTDLLDGLRQWLAAARRTAG